MFVQPSRHYVLTTLRPVVEVPVKEVKKHKPNSGLASLERSLGEKKKREVADLKRGFGPRIVLAPVEEPPVSWASCCR